MGNDSKTNVFTLVLSGIFVVGTIVGLVLFAGTNQVPQRMVLLREKL